MLPNERKCDDKLSKEQRERLVLLIEECGEVIQAATKTLRWGYDDTHPETGENNHDMLLKELADLETIKLLFYRSGDLVEVPKANQKKMVKLRRYTLHQPPEILASILLEEWPW